MINSYNKKLWKIQSKQAEYLTVGSNLIAYLKVDAI